MKKETLVPHFLVAGMPRCATTYLYHNLAKHPSIFLPFRKEPAYFGTNFDQGIQWYQSLFRDRRAGQICGDVSPPVFFDDNAVSRIKSYPAGLKIIFIVRDPAEWALSLYAQFKSFTFNMPPFAEFLDGFIWANGNKKVPIRITNGHLVDRVNEYRAEFGRNLLLYNFDFFSSNPLLILNTIEDFLGISRYFEPGNFDDVKINASARRNVKLISYLLSRELTIGVIERCVPRRLTLFLRGRFDFFSAAGGPSNRQYRHAEEDGRIAKELLADQRRSVNELFEAGPVQLGDGTPVLEWPCDSGAGDGRL